MSGRKQDNEKIDNEALAILGLCDLVILDLLILGILSIMGVCYWKHIGKIYSPRRRTCLLTLLSVHNGVTKVKVE